MNDTKISSGARSAFIAALVLTAIALLIDNAIVGWLIAIPVLFLIFYVMSEVPLRVSLLALMFCGLALENPSEAPAAGQWQSPWFPIGSLMLMHLKKTIGGGLFFSGMDVMLVALAIINWRRKSNRSRIDAAGNVPVPKPLKQLAYLSLGGALFVLIVGIIRGGADMSMAVWQLDRVIYVPVVFLLFQAGLRGPQDIEAVGKVILAAGTLRALQAGYVRMVVVVPPDPMTGESGLPYATTHNDSMLFAWTMVVVVALIIHRARGSLKIAAITPIMLWGMLANNRRLVWVQLILVLGTLYVTSAMTPIKRKIQRTFLMVSPVLLLYIGIGWSAASKIFKPVHIIRTAIDSKTDTSTQWRDIENFDLLATFKQSPVFGSGYGHPFSEVVPLPAVDYELEKFIPHNSIAGLWAYCGYIGYTMMTALWVGGVYFSLRAYHSSTSALERTASITAFGAVLIYYLQCYGDMGLGSWTGVFMVAPSLAIAGKLCVANGAWVGAPLRTGPKPAARPVAQSPNARV